MDAERNKLISDLQDQVKNLTLELNRREWRFEALVENLHVAVFRNTPGQTGKFIDVNDAFIEMFGFDSRQEMLDLDVADLYQDPADRTAYNETMLKRSEIRNAIVHLKKKSGELIIGRVSSIAVENEAGEVLHYDGIVEDVTEEYALRDRLELARKRIQEEHGMFLDGPVMLFRWSPPAEQPLEFVSKNVKSILGYSADDFLKGKIFFNDLIHEDDRENFTAEIRDYVKKGTDSYVQSPYRLRRTDGSYLWVLDHTQVSRDENGEPLSFLGHVIDIDEYKIAQDELIASEQRYRNLIHRSPVGIVQVDKLGNVLDINPSMLEILGAPSAEATREINVFNFPTIEATGIVYRLRMTLETGTPAEFETPYTSIWGKSTYLRGVCGPIMNSTGEITALQIYIQDISDQRAALTALEASERRLREAGRMARMGTWELDVRAKELLWSEMMYEIFGVDKNFKPSQQNVAKLVHPEDRESFQMDFQALMQGRRAEEEFPRRIVWPDGEIRHVVSKAQPITNAEGEVVLLLGFTQDVSVQHQIQRQLKISLQEKETLLREIHHRVKNNMQVISSLLNMQADQAADDFISEQFAKIQARIRTMSLVHEKLFQSESYAEIDFGIYLESLITELARFHELDQNRIKLTVNVDNVPLDISRAIPCGLIVNELMTNSMKYAFPDSKRGNLGIYLGQEDQDTVLRISDDGVGLPGDIDISETESLGLRIVRILCEQLKGTLEVTNERGSIFIIRFPLDSA